MLSCYEHAYSHQRRFKAGRPGMAPEVFSTGGAEFFNEVAYMPLNSIVNKKIFERIVFHFLIDASML